MIVTMASAGVGEWESPTLGFRFLRGRLQQCWSVHSIATDGREYMKDEWRDVPDATPQGPTP